AHGPRAIARPVPVRPVPARLHDRVPPAVDAACGLEKVHVRRDAFDERWQQRPGDVRRETETRRRFALALFGAGERVRDALDVFLAIDERANAAVDERHVEALRLVAPRASVAFVVRHAMRDDQPLDLQECGGKATAPDRERWLRHRSPKGETAKEIAVLDGHAALGHADERAVFPAHNAALLAVDHGHRNSVIITGANEPTISSCPSREQTTPG